jgi:hypothetical protein
MEVAIVGFADRAKDIATKRKIWAVYQNVGRPILAGFNRIANW